MKLFLKLALVGVWAVQIAGHVEDVCVMEGGDVVARSDVHESLNIAQEARRRLRGGGFLASLRSAVQPFFSLGEWLRCGYNDKRPGCVVASLLPQVVKGFNDTSACRGMVHFFAIYYIGVSQGYSQEAAYFLAAFSQGIDFVQYKAIDSCGRTMDDKWWTPPMRGFLRTNVEAGGTQRHLGVPYVGHFKGSKLTDQEKQFKSSGTCKFAMFRKPTEYYVKRCSALSPDLSDNFYEGALSSGRLWAFGETDLICAGGFTTIGEDGSPFTGSDCPKGGEVEPVDISKAVSGPIPLTGGNLKLGKQLANYDCKPSCACYSTCSNETENTHFEKTNVVYGDQLGEYLQSQTSYSQMDGKPVPELIARMGIYLHWVADRTSHWYCTDASGSGTSIKNVSSDGLYFGNMYLDTVPCNFVTHGLTHMWEQGTGRGDKMSPASLMALNATFTEMVAFKEKFQTQYPEWFNTSVVPLSYEDVVGPQGDMYVATILRKARDRVSYFMDRLAERGLAPLPGFEQPCADQKEDL